MEGRVWGIISAILNLVLTSERMRESKRLSSRLDFDSLDQSNGENINWHVDSASTRYISNTYSMYTFVWRGKNLPYEFFDSWLRCSKRAIVRRILQYEVRYVCKMVLQALAGRTPAKDSGNGVLLPPVCIIRDHYNLYLLSIARLPDNNQTFRQSTQPILTHIVEKKVLVAFVFFVFTH